ncbi:MAG: phage tail spike protein [Christensenellales bacterium]|nr:phage tail spike protein [Christensenellales bacterium]
MKYPRIYDAGLRYIGDLRTAEISDLKIRQMPLSTVTVTVPSGEIGSFGYRNFVELFDSSGDRIDIFRVNAIPKKRYAADGMVKLTCDQALCTLKDGLIPGYHQFGGTTQNLRGAIETVLSFQDGEALWVLDQCEYDTHFEYGICDEAPYTALMMLLEPLEDPIIVTDTSSRPWKISVLRMTDEDASELRYSRNMEEITETVQDDEFATRLYPRGYGEGVNQLTIRDVNGGREYIEAPQAVRDLWGTVCKPYIDTTITDAETLKAKAEVVLSACQTPRVSYEVRAVDLFKLTREPMDRFYAGRMVRMIYTAYGLVIRTRVTEICYSEPIASPGKVKLTLSSQPASVATMIAELERKSKINQTYGQGSTFIYADSFEQNCDKDTPAEGDIFIPKTMIHVNAVMLKVTLSNYRADSKGAAGGGGAVSSTQAGGGSTQTSTSGGTYSQTIPERSVSVGATGGPQGGEGTAATYTEAAGSHEHSGKSHRHSVDSHAHNLNGHKHASSTSGPSPSVTVSNGSGNTSYSGAGTDASGDHTHRFNHWHHVTGAITIPGVQIAIPAHAHDVHVPDHVHMLNLPDHDHGIVYGIYKGPRADGAVVRVDGREMPESAFENGEGDIAPYLSTDERGKIRRGVYHTISITPRAKEGNESGLCRIRASWNAQVFISSLTGRQY